MRVGDIVRRSTWPEGMYVIVSEVGEPRHPRAVARRKPTVRISDVLLQLSPVRRLDAVPNPRDGELVMDSEIEITRGWRLAFAIVLTALSAAAVAWSLTW